MTQQPVSVRFVPIQEGQDRLLRDPHGPWGQRLTRICNEVANEARTRANVDTGYMRSRIEFTVLTAADGTLEGIVAARTNYSLYVHEGARGYAGNPFLTDALHAVLARY